MHVNINYEYLRELDNPSEAITNNILNNFKYEIQKKGNSAGSDIFQNILNQDLIVLCRKTGLRWGHRKLKLSDLLKMRINDIKQLPKVERKNCIWLLAKLVEFDNYELQKLYEIPKEHIIQTEYEELLESIRYEILKSITKTKTLLVADNSYEPALRDLLKKIISELFRTNKIKTNDKKRYVHCFIYRVYGQLSLEEIAEKLNIYSTQANQILNVFKREIDRVFPTYEDKQKLADKWSRLYTKAFNTLDDSDLKTRNKRLHRLRVFQELFIAKNLKYYID